jgi:hypothetical protein
VLWNVVIDLDYGHGRANVRLQRRYFVLGYRRAGIIVGSYANVVSGPRLQLAQGVRLLHLNNISRSHINRMVRDTCEGNSNEG